MDREQFILICAQLVACRDDSPNEVTITSSWSGNKKTVFLTIKHMATEELIGSVACSQEEWRAALNAQFHY